MMSHEQERSPGPAVRIVTSATKQHLNLKVHDTVHMQGTVPGHPEVYCLSQQHKFKVGVPTHVDSAMKTLLSSSWLAKHFHLQVHTSANMHMVPNSARLRYVTALPSKLGCATNNHA